MKKIKDIERTIVIILFLIALMFMTIGFAFYGQTVNWSGNVTVKPDGKIYISSVQKGTLNYASANPEITASGIDFNLSFTTNSQTQANGYTAEFIVTITNDSSYDYVFSMPNYTPRINRQSNGASIDSSYLGYTISNIAMGDIIPSKSSVTFNINFTFVNPLNRQYDTFVIDGDFEPSVSEDTSANLYASVDDSVVGDLTGNNERAAFSINVINTYNVQKTFTIALDSDKFDVAYVNNATSYTIDANDPGETYTFYVVKKQGSEHITNTERIGVSIVPTGDSEINAGRISVLVDQNSYYEDERAPIISDVSVEISNTQGTAIVSWNGTDEDTYPESYTVIIYKDGAELRRVSTVGDETSMEITGLADGNYYFVVIGVDPFENTATATEIANATTSPGHACKSENITLKWVFTVTFNLTNFKSKQQDTAYRGQNYSTTLEVSSSSYYLPGSITITVDGEELNKSYYTYNSSTGAVTIPGEYITGNIKITATANSGFCLVEGTRILLADGKYKNIEEIKYTDLLKVYNHVNGETTEVYPIWIEKEGESQKYTKITLEDGSQLKIVNSHCVFDADKKRYVDISNPNEFGIGSNILKIKNDKLEKMKVINIEDVEETVKFYNVVSTMYYNIIANDILTTDPTSSISNIYGFKENAIYGKNYYRITNGKDLDYKSVDFLPFYLYKGLNLKNVGGLNKFFDISFLGRYIENNTVEVNTINGDRYFKVTTQYDYDNDNDEINHLYKEGSKYKLPECKGKYYIETSTGKKYKSGEEITVEYSTHFKIKE